ncbi:LysE family translocator [Marinomonas sp. C2222]|uniref:LysE family translocator n=1 Tax=Marinomonas sargassi TaxID=2984494 RepID=A0ABT2YQW0_9GAMM|nr:LysE family translocator [Marinomonas sargassi]MCV2402261.1 LysE family translocator [Marinomonas sargassi]
MIDSSILPIFFTAIFFLVISPGPDLILISTYSSTRGFKSGLMISVGIFLAGIIQTLLVAFGLGQLMESTPLLAYTIKAIGALYLIWLGMKMLKSWVKPQGSAQPSNIEAVSRSNLVSKGLLNNLLNPKALVFFSSFLPQFINGTGSIPLQILVLGILLSSFALIMNIAFSLSFSKLGRLVGKKFNMGRHIDGLLGVVFLGLAARLAASK